MKYLTLINQAIEVLFLVERAKYYETAELTCNCISSFISLLVHLL
jgi:hypothetical protein